MLKVISSNYVPHDQEWDVIEDHISCLRNGSCQMEKKYESLADTIDSFQNQEQSYLLEIEG